MHLSSRRVPMAPSRRPPARNVIRGLTCGSLQKRWQPDNGSCAAGMKSGGALRLSSANDAAGPETIVRIRYSDLVQEPAALSPAVEKAFGSGGLGIIGVDGVPGFMEARLELLHQTARFAALPEDVKAQLYPATNASSTVGWSKGNETTSKNTEADVSKGSFYATFPGAPGGSFTADEKRDYPRFCQENIWPDQHVPQLQLAFEGMMELMCETGLHIAELCDRYMEQRADPGAPFPPSIRAVLQASRTHKARLLNYTLDPYRTGAPPGRKTDDWCGWHSDLSMVTALVAGAYFDAERRVVASPDPASGLYVRTPEGREIQVHIPEGCMAFQVGDMLKKLSGGLLLPTEHCVKAPQRSSQLPTTRGGVSRNAVAMFLQPDASYPLPGAGGVTFGELADKKLRRRYMEGIKSV